MSSSRFSHSRFARAAIFGRRLLFAASTLLPALGLILHPGAASAETILASKHDLSIAGRGAIKASTESEV